MEHYVQKTMKTTMHCLIKQNDNKLYEKGEKIILFTARGAATGIDWKELTKKQLKDWNVKHHELRFGKPHADVFIDDKAQDIFNWFN